MSMCVSSSKCEFGKSTDYPDTECIHGFGGESMDCLLNPRIEQNAGALGLGTIHGLPTQSMDPCLVLGNPWIVQTKNASMVLVENPWTACSILILIGLWG